MESCNISPAGDLCFGPAKGWKTDMHYLGGMDIAGISFSVWAEEEIRLKEQGPDYRSFFRREEVQSLPDIRIDVVRLPAPEPEGMELVFDGGGAWSLYRGGGQWALELVPEGDGARMAMAYASHDFSRVLLHPGKDGPGLVSPLCYPLDQILFLHRLIGRGGVLLHASGISSGGAGLVFAGRSGAGKSTLAQSMTRQKGLRMLSDDRIAVRPGRDAYYAHGTPWSGTANMAANESARLAGLVFLRQDRVNRIQALSVREATERLLPVASIPWYDKASAKAALAVCEDLCFNVPAFDLFFSPGAQASQMCMELLDVARRDW